MTYLICPGIHEQKLTDSFLDVLKQQEIPEQNFLVLPGENYPPFSALHIVYYLQQQYKNKPFNELTFISFSAGVVGAIGAAWIWQQLGRKVGAFIAVDGWGVPLFGDFPIYRLSHDYFTHWSSALLGAGEKSFYAEPPVKHLDLWKAPHLVTGWRISQEDDTRTTAVAFLTDCLKF